MNKLDKFYTFIYFMMLASSSFGIISSIINSDSFCYCVSTWSFLFVNRVIGDEHIIIELNDNRLIRKFLWHKTILEGISRRFIIASIFQTKDRGGWRNVVWHDGRF